MKTRWLILVSLTVGALITNCGRSLQPQSNSSPIQPPAPSAQTKFIAAENKDYGTPSCVAQIDDNQCSIEPIIRLGDQCLNGQILIKNWTIRSDGSVANAHECAPTAGQEKIDCSALCIASGNPGGLCFTRSLACFGQVISAGMCDCDI